MLYCKGVREGGGGRGEGEERKGRGSEIRGKKGGRGQGEVDIIQCHKGGAE